MGVYEGLTQVKPGMHWVSDLQIFSGMLSTYSNFCSFRRVVFIERSRPVAQRHIKSEWQNFRVISKVYS